MTLKGFETISDFQIYGTAAFKISVASALGGGLSPADVVISQVCDSTGSCSAVTRVIQGRRSSASDVTVISDCYMHKLACIAPQYMPIRVRCIGMYCGMCCGMYWWYVLNTYQHVFNTNWYVFNTYLSVLVCIVLVLCKY